MPLVQRGCPLIGEAPALPGTGGRQSPSDWYDWGRGGWGEDDWDWEGDWKDNWKDESLDKRQEESLDKRQEQEVQQNTWRTGASDAAPLSKKGRPAGSGTVSHKRRLRFQQRSYEKRTAREKEEAELKKQQEEEEQRLKTEEEEEKKKKEAENMEKEKEKVKEDKKEEKKTLAQRVKDEPKKAAHDQREKPPAIAAQEIDTSMEDVSSSDGSMDCRDSRSKQRGRGQTPKLDFGPSKLEMVKEEAAEKKKQEKAAPQPQQPLIKGIHLKQFCVLIYLGFRKNKHLKLKV